MFDSVDQIEGLPVFEETNTGKAILLSRTKEINALVSIKLIRNIETIDRHARH
jgi:hypothetical protein